MLRFITRKKTTIVCSFALALGFLLVPVTVTPAGVEANVVCAAEGEGPDGNCTFALYSFCKYQGEIFNNTRRVIN